MNRGLRIFGILITFAMGAYFLHSLTQSFDASDGRRAQEFVDKALLSPRHMTLRQMMAEKESVSPESVRCAAQVESSFAGTVLVRCLAGKKAYEMKIDVVGFRLASTNENLKQLMEKKNQ